MDSANYLVVLYFPSGDHVECRADYVESEGNVVRFKSSGDQRFSEFCGTWRIEPIN
jgi:hypothetical protein